MEITRNTLDTSPGPADWFTGTVYIDTIAAPGQASTLGAAAVHFTPGARTAWHSHPLGQTIWVTEGIGLCQREGGDVEVIRPGDVRCEGRDEPRIVDPADAIIRVSAACVCGSDLWPYRGIGVGDDAWPMPMGHEYVGIVEEVGRDVETMRPGQFVVGSFWASDNTCPVCRGGYQS